MTRIVDLLEELQTLSPCAAAQAEEYIEALVERTRAAYKRACEEPAHLRMDEEILNLVVDTAFQG